jgi:hypothetical protein
VNWIVAAGTPWMAATHPFETEQSPPENPVFLDGLRSINRAAGEKPARLGQKRRYDSVICRQDKVDHVSANSIHYFVRPLLSMRISRISVSTSCQERFTALFLAIMSTSWLGTIWWRYRRKHSLRSRLTRFRTTAFPTFELTVTPRRASPRSFSLVNIKKWGA